jgi:hypothetical protein
VSGLLGQVDGNLVKWWPTWPNFRLT